MTLWIWGVAIITFAISVLVTRVVCRLAEPLGLVDVPNARSSHTTPTPRGGGLAIVVSSGMALMFLTVDGILSYRLFMAIAGGGFVVAATGLIDDLRPLPAAVRLPVHFAAAIWAVAWIGPVEALRMGDHMVHLGLLGAPLTVVAIAWFLNVFNFMDGIDGIAASEAIFVCGFAILPAIYITHNHGAIGAATAIGAASAGFLVWNWPPARIFMGDVGSGYLGFAIAVIAVAEARTDTSAVWTWLIATGIFVIDSSVTLIRRLSRGERISVAHRSHAYQHLARKIGHKAVTKWVAAINLIWLLPLAFLSVVWPVYGYAIALACIFPLLIAVVLVGAGKGEHIHV